jgi:glycosyltransferase involved in cell wall biosynthesis
MKVLWVSHSSGLAGAERALLEGVRAVASEQISIHVVAPSQGALTEAIASLGVPVSFIRYGWWMSPKGWRSPYYRAANGARNLLGWRAVSRFLRTLKPDLVITNTLVIPIWAMASKKLGIPHVWFLHESGDAEGDTFDLGSRWTFKLVDDLSLLVIVNSRAAENSLRRFVPAEKIRLASYAVETPDINGRKTNSAPLSLALVGRVSANKGQAEAIEAMSLLVRKNLNVHLKIIGDTDSKFSRDLRRRAGENDLARKVEFLPFSDNPFQHLSDTDLALMCSHKETFGRVTVEAMKMGKPVVGAAIDATRELIRDGWNGLLYEPGNVNDLADKISTLYHDRATLAVMGERARTWATNQFNTSRYAQQLTSIFEEAISRWREGSKQVN